MRIDHIKSPDNPKVKVWKSLMTSKGIKEHRLCLLSGRDLILEFLKSKNESFHTSCLFFSEDHLETRVELLETIEDNLLKPISLFSLSPKIFDELDVVGTHDPILVLEVPDQFAQKVSATEISTIEKSVALPLGDPSNLGAAIRSSIGFGISHIILTDRSASCLLPKAIKASAGAIFKANVTLLRDDDLMTFFEKQGSVISLDSSGKSLKTFTWPKSFCLFLGEEGPGLKQYQAMLAKPMVASKHTTISIPTTGIESLNATVALSIALYSQS